MASGAPGGIVSFLFTDVEGSTRLWEEDPVGMAASLAAHDRIVRVTIERRRGHVFSTAGDAFAAAFHTTNDALDAAIDAQLALAAQDWPGPPLRVRMGIHTGEAEERDGDYFGPVLNRAARIMAAGHGGQVLVSATTAQLSATWRPNATSLIDLGTHRIHDLDEPEQLLEIRHPELPVVDRPLRTVDVQPHNLPDYLTTFVGRDPELDEISSLVADSRLVVLTGAGGTGKTRLAVEAARQAIDAHRDGAWLVELAPLTNPAFIMTAIGDVWGLRPGEGATIEDVVTRYLWSREMLLVVDNCEHLLDGAAAAIGHILNTCPTVRIVATSRESLGIAGEALLRVPSLGLPEDAATLREAEAVVLFLDRARLAEPGFEPDDSDLDAIGRICTRIDGIPLGLELAAARLRSMSAVELADRLDESFRILSGAKTALPRQQTLEATIDWSHELLKPDERAVFRRLSIFAGGFDLAAAEAVTAGGEVVEHEIIDHIDSLVDKSLVVPSMDRAKRTRYRLLEPVRQYARSRLDTAGETASVAGRHAHHYAAFVAEAGPHTRGPDQMAWERRIDDEYDNIRLAFTTMLESGDIDRHLDTCFELFVYWMHVGMHLEGIATTVTALEQAPAGTDPNRLIKSWWTAAGLGAEITRPESVDHARRGLAIAETMDDPNALGRMELQLGASIRHATTDPAYLEHLLEGRRLLEENPEPHWWEPRWEHGFLNLIYGAYLPQVDDRLKEHLDAAVTTFEEVGDRALLAAALGETASLWGQVDQDLVIANLARAVDILDQINAPYWHGHALYYLGVFLHLTDRQEEAVGHLTRGAAHLEDSGDLSCWAGATRYLVESRAELGGAEPACSQLVAVIDAMPVLPMPEVAKPRTLDTAAKLLLACGRLQEAAVALGCAQAIELPITSVLPRGEKHEQMRAALVDALGAEDASRLLAQGAALAADEALQRITGWLRE